MTLVLVSPTGDRRFRLPIGTTLVVGRDPTCDLPILDGGVSRKHAELIAYDDELEVRDMGSRNGTYLNGKRVTAAKGRSGDRLTFGGVELTIGKDVVTTRPTPSTPPAFDGSATMVSERAMPSTAMALAAVNDRRLAQLVSVAQRLGGVGSVSVLLTRIVDDLFETFAADRVAVLLYDADGTLDTRIARDRSGELVPRTVPRAIANGVASRQVALLSHDAREDTRIMGQSVVQQSVRAALAAPLLSGSRATLGVLYVDSQSDAHAFTETDLDFLVAYAGIAAAAVEREQSTEHLLEATRVRENFERYFTPQLAERIATHKGDVTLGGERRPVCVLFSDIRNFTDIAASLPPDQMAAQLNEYFAVMVDCVFRHQGALDKFIGDALMAYWGAPVSADDDANRAMAAARDMQSELVALNLRWAAAGMPMLHAGIGINHGDAFVGNIGSPRRLEYTLIGDTVNVANRLCDMASGGEVLVTAAFLAAMLPSTEVEVKTQERPELVPPGRSGSPVVVHSVIEPVVNRQAVTYELRAQKRPEPEAPAT